MKTKVFILVLCLQCLILIGMVVQQESLFRTAQPITIDAGVYDPRDPIKGQYVALSYPAAILNLSQFEGGHPTAGQKVFVEFSPEKNSPIWAPTRSSTNCFEPSSTNQLFQAKVVYIEETQWTNNKSVKLSDPKVHVDYGINRFYVNEEKGNPRGRLTAVVVARKNGKAFLKDLLVDGKSIRSSTE